MYAVLYTLQTFIFVQFPSIQKSKDRGMTIVVGKTGPTETSVPER